MRDQSHDLPCADEDEVEEVIKMRSQAQVWANLADRVDAALMCKQVGMLALNTEGSLAERDLRPQGRYLEFFRVVREADESHLTHLADLLASHQRQIGRDLMQGWIEGKNL